MRQENGAHEVAGGSSVASRPTTPPPDGTVGAVTVRTDEPEQFGVDLRGIVDVLSHHLYSSPRVYLRELLQNATDAVAERARIEDGHVGAVDVTSARDGAPLVVRDDGIGLTAEEMRTLLATVGGTNKGAAVDLDGTRARPLGRFGIGLLSAFLVADVVEVRSRSAADPDAGTIRWVGRAEGTFTISVADEPLDRPGTEVRVHPRPEDAHRCDPDATLRLATDVAEHLTTPIRVDGRLVSQVTPPWDLPVDEQVAWCRDRLGFEPLGIIALDSVLRDVRGVGFVLPYTAMPGHRTGDRLYSGGMLVAETGGHVLPGWAFFCRAVLDGGDLSLTASREGFQETPALELVRRRLGNVLVSELILAQAMNPDAFAEVLRLHADGLKALAVESRDMLDLLRSTLPFATTVGERTLDGLAAAGEPVRYVRDSTLHASLVDLARTTGVVLLDAGGPYDVDVLTAFDPDGRLLTELTAADVEEVAAPERVTGEAAERLVARAAPVLAPDVIVEVAELPLADRPVLWWPHATGGRGADRPASTLLLNAANDAVRTLLDTPDDLDLADVVRSLHTLGRLQSAASLDAGEVRTLGESLGRIVTGWASPAGPEKPVQGR